MMNIAVSIDVVIERDCLMGFDSEEVLLRHKQKFCVTSKYANLDSLTSQF
jgi:hypothetical protein